MKRQTYMVLIVLMLAVWLGAVSLTSDSSADPSWRGWTYSDQPPANPQPGDGWMPMSRHGIYEVTASELNVRSGPGTQFRALHQFQGGDRVRGIGSGEWVELADGGWVSSEHLHFQPIHHNLRYWTGTYWEPVGSKWHKIATRTDDDWPKLNVLDVEPGMPQALGFESWQAMADDIDSPDGVISEIGLQYKSNAGNEVSNWFESFPANGLAPGGYPYITCSEEKWLYFSTDRISGVVNPLARTAAKEGIWMGGHGIDKMFHLRLQGTNCVQGLRSGPTTPVLVPFIPFDVGMTAITIAVYVKI